MSDHALTLKPALAAVAADRDAARQRVADTVKTATVPDDQAQQAQRIWARAQHRLDAAEGVAQKATAAQEMIAGAEGLTLATYREGRWRCIALGGSNPWAHRSRRRDATGRRTAMPRRNRRPHTVNKQQHATLVTRRKV
jgi:hypothetical protein